MRDVVWLLFLGAALTGGLIYHAFAVSLAAAAGFLLAGIASIWRRYGLAGVSYDSSLDRAYVPFGETVRLRTGVTNGKLLPLPWITIRQDVPAQLHIRGATVVPSETPLTATMVNALAMLPYERVVRRFDIHCTHRGCFEFAPALVESGDPFGLVRNAGTDGARSTLTVYPKVRDVVNVGAPAQGLTGNVRLRRWFPHDPLAVVGARPYVQGEPIHSIDWRATARFHELHVRELESTANPQLAIFLDTHAGDSPVLECAISFAASLVVDAIGRGWAAGLYAAPASAGPLRIALRPARGSTRILEVLERLAALTPSGDESYAQLLEAEARRLPFGATPCAIVVEPDEDGLLTLARLSERRMTVIFALDVEGSAARLAARLPRAQVIHVPFDADWAERDVVTIGV